jgi:hypothetical protein
MRVFVYWNLHKDCWSVKALEGENKGRVIKHANNINLTHCTFKVSKAGRERVLREKRKNVHAGVVGNLSFVGEVGDTALWECASAYPAFIPVTYNPYKYSTFVRKNNDYMEVHTSPDVFLNQDRSVFAMV